MRLYEFEGKRLLAQAGIPIPQGRYVARARWEKPGARAHLKALYQELGNRPVMVKAQVLAGKRGKAGGVQVAETSQALVEAVQAMFSQPLLGQEVMGVLIESRVDGVQEAYLALTYDTVARAPVLLVSRYGGVDVETLARERPEAMVVREFEPTVTGLLPWMARDAALQAGFSGRALLHIPQLAVKLWQLMVVVDARLVEINPLMRDARGAWVAVDAAIILDDDGLVRHPELDFPPRQATGRPLTSRELAARAIDEGDYRGVAGKYVELDGDIGMLTMGGGGSITLMDAVIAYGGRPANYTEYGGNPPAEKVYRLTRIVASKPGLRGLLIAGGIANNTRIDEAMRGVARALAELRPTYPIVARQAGPGEEEGRRLLQQLVDDLGLDIAIYGAELPMTEAARVLMEKVIQGTGYRPDANRWRSSPAGAEPA